MMSKLLWIGDAGCDSGFARATHATLETLRKYWDIYVLALNYRGDPHPYPYPLYPASYLHSDSGFGLQRLPELMQKIGPDVVVIQNDPWNFPGYLKMLTHVPVVGAIAVDGLNCRGRSLNGLAMAIFWTEFGREQAQLGGYTGPAAVVPLGIDLDFYNPQDRKEARRLMGLPKRIEDAFIVGNVNRNQPRKRFDLTIQYFAEWVKKYDINDAYLFLHVAPTGDRGYDCEQLAGYYGVGSRIILSQPALWHGVDELRMAATYNSFDVQLSTTQGEGWGLTTLEGMACGVPQIVPDWAALGEWPGASVYKIPCTTTAATFNNINVIGGIPDRVETIKALNAFYRDPQLRTRYSRLGLEVARDPRFDWAKIGELFAEAVARAVNKPIALQQAVEV